MGGSCVTNGWVIRDVLASWTSDIATLLGFLQGVHTWGLGTLRVPFMAAPGPDPGGYCCPCTPLPSVWSGVYPKKESGYPV